MSDKEQMSGNTDLENAPTGFYSSHEEGAPEAVEDERPSHDSLGKIYTGGDDNEYIYIGRQKFLKSDLFEAFGGTLNPGLAPPSVHKFANPAPLGLSAFALTTFVLSMFNARAQGITAVSYTHLDVYKRQV